MKVAEDFRHEARHKLGERWAKGPWGIFAMATLFAILIGAAVSVIANVLGWEQIVATAEDGSAIYERVSNPAVTALGALLVTGIIEFSNHYMSLRVFDEKAIQSSDVFYGYKVFGKAFLSNLLVVVFLTLWSLLLIIPGIIMSFAYAMTPYILLDDDNISVMDAIKKSKELMKGHKWRLFCMEFSFIGWLILSILTLGILYIWIAPYIYSAKAAFYRDLVPAKEEPEVVAEEVEFKEKAEETAE